MPLSRRSKGMPAVPMTRARPPEDRPRSFEPGFKRLLAATTVSGLGDGMRTTAFAVFAAALSDDPIQVALVTVCTRLPWLFVGPYAGALVDHVNRWRALWICDVARALVLAAFIVLIQVDRVGIAVLAVAAFVLSSIETMADNLSQAVVPDVVGTSSLNQANSRLMGGQFVSTDFLGAPLGTTLFAITRSFPFIVDSISFALSAVLVFGTRGRGGHRASGAARTTLRRLHTEMAEGLRWLWRHRTLRTVCVLIGLLNFSVLAVLSTAVLYALHALKIDQRAYGLLLVVVAVGGLAGLLLAPRIVAAIGPARSLRLAFAVCPLALLVGAVTSHALFAASALTLVGASISLATVVTTTLRQEVIPTELFGRVNGGYRLVVNGLSPLGGLAGGLVATAFGLRAPFVLATVVMAGVTAVSFLALSGRALAAPGPTVDAT